MAKPRKEQFSGCLIGQCLGDALGFIVEGYTPETCRRCVEQLIRTGRVVEYGRGPFPFGQYTDDSQLARELLQSYVACGGFDPENYANRIAAIFAQGRIVGRGLATDEAARRLLGGVPWEQAGAPPPSAGNGSAMRAGPVGLMFFDDGGALVRAAHDQGRITHQDPRCSAGAVAIAGAVALALRDGPVEAAGFTSQLAQWVGSMDEPFAAFVGQLTDWVALSPEEAVKPISRAGVAPDFQDAWQGISPFVVGSVLWSLYAFLRTPEDYWETICTAIAVGGDVDTTAAMAGAVSGAHNGLEAVPSHLAQHLSDQGIWGFDELVALTDKVYELKALGTAPL